MSIILAVSLVGILALAGCGAIFGNSVRLRYRIEVTVRTPDGLKTASAVQEFTRRQALSSMQPVDRGDTKRVGDAIVIPVGLGHIFINLIDSTSIVDAALRTGMIIPPLDRRKLDRLELYRLFKRSGRTATIDGVALRDRTRVRLGFTRFLDERNPVTKETGELDGSDPNFEFVSAAVTVTDAEITRQVEAILPWITAAPANAFPYASSILPSLSDRARMVD